jgi:hypothetical protein
LVFLWNFLKFKKTLDLDIFTLLLLFLFFLIVLLEAFLMILTKILVASMHTKVRAALSQIRNHFQIIEQNGNVVNNVEAFASSAFDNVEISLAYLIFSYH